MKVVELYGRVRYAVQIEGLSQREAARRFGIDPRTVAKMMKFSAPPGYVRTKAPARPKLDPFIPVIDRILFDDKSRPRKQQHTAKGIFERPCSRICSSTYGRRRGHRGAMTLAARRRFDRARGFVPPRELRADIGIALDGDGDSVLIVDETRGWPVVSIILPATGATSPG